MDQPLSADDRHALVDVELTPYPVVTNRLDSAQWLASRSALRVLFPEYTKYLVALARTSLMPKGAGLRIGVIEADAHSGTLER